MDATIKPSKPSPDFPLYAHARKRWAKKIAGKVHYFGSWDDPQGALAAYERFRQDGAPSDVVSVGGRPAKPNAKFPLFPHASKRWAKKILGKTHYFGPWSDPKGALDRYLEQKDALHSGREVAKPDGNAPTVKYLIDKFLNSKRRRVESGELAQRTFDGYQAACVVIAKAFGNSRPVDDLGPTDFGKLRANLAKRFGPVTLGNAINRIRILFRYGSENGLIEKAVRYGSEFDRPSRKTLRIERAKKGKRMFESDQLAAMLAEAAPQLRAMILLGVNCGLGNTDCSGLTFKAIDLEAGWLDYARAKTGIERRCPLWPETVDALKAAIAGRPEPHAEADSQVVFITRYRRPWQPKSKTDCPISKETAKLLSQLGLKRPGLNFYALRHTFQTIGERSRDKDAVSFIMGHAAAANDMASVYREEMTDDRLRAVTDHVRGWLFTHIQSRQDQGATPAEASPA